MAKDKYQISLWEDVVQEASIAYAKVEITEFDPDTTYYEYNGTSYVETEDEEPVEGKTYYIKVNVPEHFEEFKLCDIGADDMTSTCRAYEPQLIENINGTNTFKFKMYYVYRDDGGEGELLQNPYLNLLVNERKVKVLWKDKWYDFVIKDINEDSNGKLITYTCTDLFINELSKNGFNLEFDTELENNQGTAQELVEKVLEGTDWQLGSDNDTIQQEIEEPVYEGTLSSAWTIYNQTTGAEEEIPANSTVLVYYNQLQSIINTPLDDETHTASGTASIQLAYASSYVTDSLASMLVVNADCYKTGSVTWTKNETELVFNGVLTIYYLTGVSDHYRANRLVESQQTIFDPLTDKYVKIYKASTNGDGYLEGDTIYGYQSTEYKDPTFVNNLLVNSSNFAGIEGWVGWPEQGASWRLYPSYTKSNDLSTYEAKSYLRINNSLSSCVIYNDGIHINSTSYIKDGFVNGDIYIFRYKAMRGNATAPNGTYFTASNSMLTIAVKKADGNEQPTGDAYFQVITRKNGSDNWVEMQVRCVKSASLSEILSQKISAFLVTSASTGVYVWLEEAQFFPRVFGMVDGQRAIIYPGEMDGISLANIVNKFYNHTANEGLVDVSELQYIYSGENTSLPNVDPVMHEDYVKIRSINIKQSNRFNILQTIAETFECWMRFDIEHNQETGRIVYDETTGMPNKTVTIKKEIGQETGIGFVYGLDLKTIQRTIKSSDIVTKTIVSPNNNEFATDGFCTIARSEENYPRETFILDFGYYITHGLLDGNLLNRDLYLSDGMGYYYNLNLLNTTYDQQIELLTNRKTELTKQKSYREVYNEYLTSLQSEKANLESQIIQLSNTANMTEATAYAKKNPGYTDLITKINARTMCINNITNYQKMIDQLDTSIAALEDYISDIEGQQEETVEALKALHEAFYKKYSRFIQEGSWTNEEYMDDNLYYLDAKSVAYTSSRPQVSYNISVIRVSAIDEFKGRVFKLGDITFVQDTEFFGYVMIDGIKTPYHEKVLVSEVTSNFDSPEKDTFKVQNYKTQFEDLFQRITATTQSLQYASGEYARAAAAIEPDGTINPETLQSSIALNAQLVYSARNDAILQDSTGITVTDSTNPSHKTKVTSGGVFITTDGGLTWKNAVRGEGMATQYLTSGAINTQNITILDGDAKTFRWDSQGMTAFSKYSGTNSIDVSTFTRFDRYGTYGIVGIENFKPVNEADIWNNAQFALTWRGFMLNNIEGDGRTTITSDNDIQVFGPAAEQTNIRSASTEVERIKIGRLYVSNNENGYTWDESAVPSATPNPAIVYYVFDDNSGSYVKDGLRYFTSGVYYFEGSTSKTLTTDTIPILEKSYYVPTAYTPAVLPRQFSEGTIYYELVGSNYVVTSDVTPQNGKDYYLPVEPYIPQTDLEEFESGIIYYELSDDGVYEETQDVSPVEGKIYYVTAEEKPELTVFEEAILEYYFEDGIPYFVWNDETSKYDLVTIVTPDPEVTYAVVDVAQGGWEEKVAGGNPDGFPQAFQDKAYYTRDEIVYGIRISDSTGTPVMEQNGNGDLWMTGTLHISNSYLHQTKVRYDNYDIRLGYLEADGSEIYYQKVSEEHVIEGKNYYTLNEDGLYVLVAEPIDANINQYYEQVNLHQVFNVNSGNFRVYENGTVYALNGHFSGDVEAHSGMFGTRNDDGTGNYVTVSEDGLKAYNGGLAVYKQEMLYKPLTGLEEFETGVIYYELVNDDYVVTEDATPQSGKTYYIYQEEQLVFGYDPNSGYLTVAGGATLTGAIEATSGSFSGDIYAAGGQIGGFIISRQYNSATDTWIDSLKSAQGQYVKTTDTQVVEGKAYYVNVNDSWERVENPVVEELDNYYEVYANVQLYGQDGTIITNSLHMGTVENADVEITLGNARLYNPQLREGHEFIEIVDDNNQQLIALTDTANLRLGNIIANGNSSILYLGDPNSSSYISLDGDNQVIASGSESSARNYFSISNAGATFNNVNIKGKITASIFEIGKIQTVGGAFLFKPSARIDAIKETNSIIELTLNGTSSELDIFNVDDYVQLIDNQQQVDSTCLFKIVEHNKTASQKIVKVERAFGAFTVDEDNPPFGIIDIGQTTDETHPLLIGINSSDASLVYLPARGITISEFCVDNSETPTSSSTQIKVFLGDLSQIQNDVSGLPNDPGYGLYSDNVFLTGMLATSKFNIESANFVYAGVNTLNGESYLGPGGSSDSSGQNYGNIVFWGGATANDGKIDIQHAPFIVTDKGYMYAGNGFFTGSVWVEGDIHGADIYTSRIHGDHNGQGYGLGIFDTKTGIIFGHDWVSDANYSVDYKLDNTGLSTRNNTTNIPIIQLNGTGTSALSVNMYGSFNTSSLGNYYKLDENGLQFGQDFNSTYSSNGSVSISNEDMTLAYGTNQIKLQPNTTIFNNEIDYGENFQYKPARGGYDLYVTAAASSGS